MGWFSKLFSGGNEEEVKPKCVENSVYAALTYALEKRLPVRIVISRFTAKPGRDHAQAQAQIDGAWKWLTVTRYSTIIEAEEDQFGPDYGTKEHYKFLTIKDLMMELDQNGMIDNSFKGRART